MFKYSSSHCNIKGCNDEIHKHCMCEKHYKLYVSNPNVKKICDEYEQIHLSPKPPFKLVIKQLVHFIIHHTVDYPMYLVEHFPLEHVFLGNVAWLNTQKNPDKSLVENLISDFDLPENENLPMLNRMVNSQRIEDMKIGSIQSYLLEKNDLPSLKILVCFILGVLFCYVSLKIGVGYSGLYFMDFPFDEVVIISRKFLIVLPLLGTMIYAGIKLPSSCLPLIARAYELKLFQKPEDNMNVLKEALYVKERNKKLGSYKAQLLGICLGQLLLILILFFKYSTLHLVTILFLIGILLLLFSVFYTKTMLITYLPICASMQKKMPQILFQHGDMAGGIRDFLIMHFYSFLFNELVIFSCLCVAQLYNASIWVYFLIFFLLFFRICHARASLRTIINGIQVFRKQKNNMIKQLRHSDAPDTIIKLELLEKIHLFRFMLYVKSIIAMLILPFLISVAANNIDTIVDFIRELSNLVKYLTF